MKNIVDMFELLKIRNEIKARNIDDARKLPET